MERKKMRIGRITVSQIIAGMNLKVFCLNKWSNKMEHSLKMSMFNIYLFQNDPFFLYLNNFTQ